jgi:hypothetical protein
MGSVSHLLSDAQKAAHVESSQSLLRVRKGQHGRAWHGIVTLDQSWFDGMTAHEWI